MLDWTRDRAPTAATRSLMPLLEWGEQTTIVMVCHFLTVLAPQGMPSSSGLALALMPVAAGLAELERWVTGVNFRVLTMLMMKPGERGLLVARHFVLIALEPQGMLSLGGAAALIWVVADPNWLEFEVNWVSSLMLTVQTAALLLGHRLMAENPTASVVPQEIGSGMWRDSPLAPVMMARQLMLLLQEQVWKGVRLASVLRVQQWMVQFQQKGGEGSPLALVLSVQ